MKKVLPVLVAIVLLTSCNSDQAIEKEKTGLLTAVAWKTGPTSDYGVEKFNIDRTYTMKFKDISMEARGTWEWISPNEISMHETEMVMNGVINKLNVKSTDKTIVKIASLSSNELIGLTHHALDAEDSNFAKEIVYTAE
jgi:hypothetical protein